MSDDLVKRAREWNFCWPSHDVEVLVPAMANRIEELEVKLAKAQWLLCDASVQLREGKIRTRRNRADLIDTFLAELKGNKDQ